MKGKIQSVDGSLDPTSLGVVLPHEHLKLQIYNAFHMTSSVRPHLADCQFTLQNIGWIRQYPYSHNKNMILDTPDVDKAHMEDVKAFKEAGGGTLVDNTTRGMKRGLTFMKEVSETTGVNIIAGTGFYVEALGDAEILNMTVEEMAKDMTRDLTEGCLEDPSIKCGILGEIGCSWPITDYEKRALRATGIVEATVGCPVMIHPGRDETAPEEAMRIYSEAGGNPKRAVMAHLDRTFLSFDTLDEFASNFGCFLEYDLFGIETSFYQQSSSIDMISDAQRIQYVKHLINEGHLDRMLISHDIHTRHRLEMYGGHGFSHLLNTVRPQMLSRNIHQDQIDQMMIHNPAKWLVFDK